MSLPTIREYLISAGFDDDNIEEVLEAFAADYDMDPDEFGECIVEYVREVRLH